nr:3134_t:CDS:10 [Entrophospora candida]
MDLFCEIIKEKEKLVAEKKIYLIAENEGVIAILDKFPASDGHTLLITKKHFSNISEPIRAFPTFISTLFLSMKKIKAVNNNEKEKENNTPPHEEKMNKQLERSEKSTSDAIRTLEAIFGPINRKPNNNDREEGGGGGDNPRNNDHGGQPTGSSIEKQQRVFTKAKELLKKNAVKGEKKPIAIVIEEIDSVGTKGNDLNIIVIATTNNPEVLNEALVRPGRLGRRITKAVGSCLETAVAEDNPKIIPDVQDFEESLRETLQTRKKDKYSKLLQEGGLFFYGTTRGSFILPPAGYALWKNIQSVLDKKFAARGVKNVLLPTLIPLDLLEKEKKHVAGFSPECFYIERIGEKKIENPLILRPTSEVLAEKNTSPFFRNTEFLWQEGHTLHSNEKEAKEFALNILSDYQDYAEKTLCLGVIVGKKTEGERFAGALETYTVECLLPDGQCLQFATSHYFGDNFCRLMGLILPFDIAPVQIAFVIIKESPELFNYYSEISSLLTPYFRCQLYNKSSRDNLNILQADKEGCPFKIILGDEELKKEEITLVRRDNVERRITINLQESEAEKKRLLALEKYLEGQSKIISEKWTEEKLTEHQKMMINSYKKGARSGKIFEVITREKEEFKKNIYQKSADFRNKHTFLIDNYPELEKKIKEGIIGLFLIPFCNKLNCEEEIKIKIPAYSIRCIKELGLSEKKKMLDLKKCLFCKQLAENMRKRIMYELPWPTKYLSNIPVPVRHKKYREIYELKNYEVKKSSLSLSARSKVIDKSGSNYVSENTEGYGPCTDGRGANDCYCSREELLRQRNTFTTNVNINNIQQIINVKFPSTGCIFRLRLTIVNQGGYSRSKEYNSVEEAINSAPRITSGQDFPDEYVEDAGFWATVGTLGMVYAVPNWSASYKIRSAAATALQSAIQNYQNGSNVNG